jgi:transposase
MEGTPLSNARDWLVENPTKSVVAASRIFGVPESTIRASITRLAQPQRQRGGHNKVLTTAQVEALKKWILRQYQLGLGATRQMTFAAVCQLRSPLPPPSQSWLTKFIKNELQEFHFITTKPIAQQRTKAQDEPTIQEWFRKYEEFLLERNIEPQSIWNMDETGFRIGIPGGERVIVPRAAKELYTPSPENRTSITILEAVSATGEVIPPVLVIPGKIHMDSWYHSNLQGTELVVLSDSGFSNSQLALRWLEHFIKHTESTSTSEMKALLLDSHISHTSDDFVITAAENNILIFTFPSHLTHILQPLDVGIFQPYKH